MKKMCSKSSRGYTELENACPPFIVKPTEVCYNKGRFTEEHSVKKHRQKLFHT